MHKWKLMIFFIGFNSAVLAMQFDNEWGDGVFQAKAHPFSSALGGVGGLFDGELSTLLEKPCDELSAPGITVTQEVVAQLPLLVEKSGGEPLCQQDCTAPLSSDDEDVSADVKESVSEESLGSKHGRWVCQYCHTCFKNRSGLFAHTRKEHAKALPLKCSCGKVYGRQCAYALHLWRKHRVRLPGVAVYNCAIDCCRKVFLSRAGLARHIRKVHTR